MRERTFGCDARARILSVVPAKAADRTTLDFCVPACAGTTISPDPGLKPLQPIFQEGQIVEFNTKHQARPAPTSPNRDLTVTTPETHGDREIIALIQYRQHIR